MYECAAGFFCPHIVECGLFLPAHYGMRAVFTRSTILCGQFLPAQSHFLRAIFARKKFNAGKICHTLSEAQVIFAIQEGKFCLFGEVLAKFARAG